MEYSYKFRLYPNQQQVQQIQRTFGCVRFIYNYYLARRIDAWKNRQETMNYYTCSADMTLLKKDSGHLWLQGVDSTALQSSLRDLDTAFQNFFHGLKSHHPVGYPKFKKKSSSRHSFKAKRVGENIAVASGKIRLPKLGLVKCRISKDVRGRILSATVSQNPAGQYYVSLCCTDVQLPTVSKSGKSCGVDLGIKELAVLSDGTIFANNKYLSASEKKLKRLQRQFSRKTKGSRRWKDLKHRIAVLHEHIANQRLDAIHKATTSIVMGYDTICMEDLNISGLLKNHKLARSVSDASFAEFRRQITYKAQYYGKNVVTINRYFPSSQQCSHCGSLNHSVKDLRIREWVCPNCGACLNRDLNAAINILTEGLKSSA